MLDAIIESDKMDVNEASRVFDILVPTFKERNEKSWFLMLGIENKEKLKIHVEKL